MRQICRTLRRVGKVAGLVVFILQACPLNVGRVIVAAETRGDEIQVAVEKAAQFLKFRQLENGAWSDYRGHQLGETALVGLALWHAERERSRAVIQAAEIVRNYCSRNADTYDTALAVMFLDSVRKAGDRRLLAATGNRIAGGQSQNAAWSYGIPGEGRADFRNTLARGDNSCTQFGVLGCWVARRHGAATDNALRNAGAYFRKSVDSNTGGWGYTANASATPSMTCAGLLGLAAAEGVALFPKRAGQPEKQGQSPRDEKQKLQDPFENPFKEKGRQEERAIAEEQEAARQPQPVDPPRPIDPMVQRAFAYLAEQLRSNPGLANDYYFLWSLERVGVIYGAETIGGVDWYEWGAGHLLAAQRPDGSWQGSYSPTIDTSFAILFLTRANMAGDLTAKLQGSGDPVTPSRAGGGNQLFKRIKRVPGNTPAAESSDASGQKQRPAEKQNPFQPN